MFHDLVELSLSHGSCALAGASGETHDMNSGAGFLIHALSLSHGSRALAGAGGETDCMCSEQFLSLSHHGSRALAGGRGGFNGFIFGAIT
jgi:hypothetical protein